MLDSAAAAPPDEIIFEQNELSEVLPRPTPLSLSLMDGLWASGGSIDLACRQLGFGYRIEEDAAPYLMTIFGRLYVNKLQETSRAPKLGSLAVWRMGRIADKLKSDFNDTFLPAFAKEMAIQEAIDFDKLPTADLLDAVARIRADYMGATCVAASIVNIAADYYLRRAREKLTAAGIEPARVLGHAEQTEFERAVSAAKAAPVKSREDVLLHGIGHRSTVDYELAAPRYAERPSDAEPFLNVPDMPAQNLGETGADHAALSSDAALKRFVAIACSFQTLKEDAKHHSLRELAVLRRALLAVDRRFMLDGLVFHLTFEELEALRDESVTASLRASALGRRQLAAGLAEVSPVGSTLTVRQIEDYAMGIKPQAGDGTGRLGGLRVSGSGHVEGRACVVKEADATAVIPGFQDGDIVVSRMVPPAWLPYFKRAGGFACEVGGWLSHTAIVAREFNVPLIVQAKGLETIETGDLIRSGFGWRDRGRSAAPRSRSRLAGWKRSSVRTDKVNWRSTRSLRQVGADRLAGGRSVRSIHCATEDVGSYRQGSLTSLGQSPPADRDDRQQTKCGDGQRVSPVPPKRHPLHEVSPSFLRGTPRLAVTLTSRCDGRITPFSKI